MSLLIRKRWKDAVQWPETMNCHRRDWPIIGSWAPHCILQPLVEKTVKMRRVLDHRRRRRRHSQGAYLCISFFSISMRLPQTWPITSLLHFSASMGLFCGKSSPDCTSYLQGHGCGKYQADSDIAGIGVSHQCHLIRVTYRLFFAQVIIAFISTSLVNLTIAFIGHILGLLRGYEENAFDSWISRNFQRLPLLRINQERTAFWRPVLERLVLLLSDYQLLFGVAILIAGFWKHCSISVYHFSLVFDLAWFSNTHMTSLSILTCYLQERPTLRNWRVCIMILMLVMMLAALVLASNPSWGASTSCPAQCLFDQPERNLMMTYPYMVALILHYSTSIWRVFDTSFFDHYLLGVPRNKLRNIDRTLKLSGPVMASRGIAGFRPAAASFLPLQFLGTVAIRIYLAVAAILGSLTISLYYDIIWFAFGLSGILRDRDMPGSNMDGDENQLSFGQIVPVLLLASIVLTFKEVYTGRHTYLLLGVCIGR